jgi:hypothetical protein
MENKRKMKVDTYECKLGYKVPPKRRIKITKHTMLSE